MLTKEDIYENGEMSGNLGATEAMMYGRESTLFSSLPFPLSSESICLTIVKYMGSDYARIDLRKIYLYKNSKTTELNLIKFVTKCFNVK